MSTTTADPAAGTPYETVIGLEVHVQLLTESKMFCSCRNRFGAEPNSQTCPVCLGLPGALPVANRQAVEATVLAGLACGCEIATNTKFDRKNYFYPDLPKGYQISQFDRPLCGRGMVEVLIGAERRRIGLTRIHLEEDAGKNVHVDGRPESLVDLNRCGVPLMEIVTEPDLRSPEEAGTFLRTLRQIMLYLGVSDCNMEEGSLRCDANVSIRPRGSTELWTRCEIKNLNSFTNVENALAHEIRRQLGIVGAGREVEQETRLYDPDRDETRGMRGKEEAHDYRYFPDPDLVPIALDRAWIDARRRALPELPLARYERLCVECGLSEAQAEVLCRDPDLARLFDETLLLLPEPRDVANWLGNAVREEMNTRGVGLVELGVTAAQVADLLRAVANDRVSRQKARDVFRAMLGTQKTVDAVIAELGLAQISDDSVLRRVVEEVVREQPKAAEDVREGKKNSVNFLVGQVMGKTRGQANPGVVAGLIRDLCRE